MKKIFLFFHHRSVKMTDIKNASKIKTSKHNLEV